MDGTRTLTSTSASRASRSSSRGRTLGEFRRSTETPGLPAFFRIHDPEEIEPRKQAIFATIP